MIDLNLEWRTVPEWPEYQVSEYGLVRRAKSGLGSRVGRRVKSWRNGQTGYECVYLWRKNRRRGMTVHRLVALAFLGEPPSRKHVVAHIDGSRDNNHHTNLRWATQRENVADTFIHGTHNRGARNGQAKLDEVCVRAIRKMDAMNIPHRVAAEGFGVCRQTIDDIVNGRRWGHLK